MADQSNQGWDQLGYVPPCTAIVRPEETRGIVPPSNAVVHQQQQTAQGNQQSGSGNK